MARALSNSTSSAGTTSNYFSVLAQDVKLSSKSKKRKNKAAAIKAERLAAVRPADAVAVPVPSAPPMPVPSAPPMLGFVATAADVRPSDLGVFDKSASGGIAIANGVETASASPAASVPALRANLASIFEVPYADLDKDTQHLFESFERNLVEEYPDLAKSLSLLKDPKSLEDLPEDQKNCFLDFLLKYQNPLKILLGYATTAWPLFIQYLYPPFVSIADKTLAGIFSGSGVFVNVALTGVVAGPVFADAIIAALSFLKKAFYDHKPGEAISETIEYWWPREWTAEQMAYLTARAHESGKGSAYTALQQALNLSMPLLRAGIASLSAYGSWILAKSFAAGALEAEAETCYPFELDSQVLQFTYWWILVSNAVTYGKDATLAFMNWAKFAPSADEKTATTVSADLDKIAFMRSNKELGELLPQLEAWFQSCTASLKDAVSALKARIVGTPLLAEETTRAVFKDAFKILINDIIAEGSKTDLSAEHTHLMRIRLTSDSIKEVMSQIMRDSSLTPAQKEERLKAAMEVLDEPEIAERLRINAKRENEKQLHILEEELSKAITMLREDHPAYLAYKATAKWPGATLTSGVFALAIINFVKTYADTNLFSTLTAVGIVYYFSDVFFFKGLKQGMDNLIRARVKWSEGNYCGAVHDVFTALIGMGTAAFSAASAMYQAGGGELPPGVLGLALELSTFDQKILISLMSAINAAGVNSYGAVQLYQMICEVLGTAHSAIAEKIVACCYPVREAAHDAAARSAGYGPIDDAGAGPSASTSGSWSDWLWTSLGCARRSHGASQLEGDDIVERSAYTDIGSPAPSDGTGSGSTRKEGKASPSTDGSGSEGDAAIASGVTPSNQRTRAAHPDLMTGRTLVAEGSCDSLERDADGKPMGARSPLMANQRGPRGSYYAAGDEPKAVNSFHLNVLSRLPADTSAYKNSYILVRGGGVNELYYIANNGTRETHRITDSAKLDRMILNAQDLMGTRQSTVTGLVGSKVLLDADELKEAVAGQHRRRASGVFLEMGSVGRTGGGADATLDAS